MKRRKDTKSHEEWMNSFENNKVNIIGKYEGRLKPIEVECAFCGNRWRPKAAQVMKGQGCRICQYINKSINYRMDIDIFDERLKEKHKDTIERLSSEGEYRGVAYSIRFKCKECGNKWTTTGSSVVNYPFTGCPRCARSKYEDKVKSFLDDLVLKYKTNVTVGDCKSVNGGLSFFDFVIDENRMLLIEVDGEQHFGIPMGGRLRFTETDFVNIVISDMLKTKYCAKNRIPLLRIRYEQIKQNNSYKKEIIAFLDNPDDYVESMHNRKYSTDEMYYKERYMTLKERGIVLVDIEEAIKNAPERRKNSNIYTDLSGREYTSLACLCKANNVPYIAIRDKYKECHDVPRCIIEYRNKKLIRDHIMQRKLQQKKERAKWKERAWQDHVGNYYFSQKEMLDHYGVSYSTFKRRIENGCSLEQALETKTLRQIHVEMYGKNFKKACEEAGMKASTVNNRMVRHGMSFEEAISMPIDTRKSHSVKRKK